MNPRIRVSMEIACNLRVLIVAQNPCIYAARIAKVSDDLAAIGDANLSWAE
jgi:hypothetical protein